MSLLAGNAFSSTSQIAMPRVQAESINPKTFAAGSGTLAVLTPVTKTPSTGYWSAWTSPVSEVGTITKAGTVTGGTFTISVDGSTTAAIAYNAANATILAALNAIPTVQPGDVVLTGGGAASVSTGALTLTFGGRLAGKAIVVSTGSASLTGGGTYDWAETTAGVQSEQDADKIQGFVWPDAIVLDATYQEVGQVLMAGIVNYSDIPLVGGVTDTQLKAALRDNNLRKLDITIQGLTGV